MFRAHLHLLRSQCASAACAQLRLLCSATAHPAASVVLEDMVTTRSRTTDAEPAVDLAQAVTNLRQACSSSAGSEAVSSKHAAVLVPLFESEGEVHVVLTQRSSKLSTHAGEVCFPGGKREPQDTDDASTALREADEELGIHPSSVTVVASLRPFLSKHLLSVTPVIGTVPADLRFSPNPEEVESVFTAPLGMFLTAGPGYSFKDVRWEGFPYRLHYWELDYRGKSYLIWGLTAGMLVVVAEKALNRKAQFEVSPPGALPYTALAYENGKLVFRGAGEGAAMGRRTAAVAGAVVPDVEVEAALGGAEEGEDDLGMEQQGEAV